MFGTFCFGIAISAPLRGAVTQRITSRPWLKLGSERLHAKHLRLFEGMIYFDAVFTHVVIEVSTEYEQSKS